MRQRTAEREYRFDVTLPRAAVRLLRINPQDGKKNGSRCYGSPWRTAGEDEESMSSRGPEAEDGRRQGESKPGDVDCSANGERANVREQGGETELDGVGEAGGGGKDLLGDFRAVKRGETGGALREDFGRWRWRGAGFVVVTNGDRRDREEGLGGKVRRGQLRDRRTGGGSSRRDDRRRERGDEWRAILAEEKGVCEQWRRGEEDSHGGRCGLWVSCGVGFTGFEGWTKTLG